MHKIKTVIVELERPIDSDDDYLVNGIADEHYGVARELVLCKDCKFWVKGKTTLNCPNPYICDFHSFMHGFERSALPEDYCAWAERKDLPYPITCDYCKHWNGLKRDGHYWCYKHSTYMDGCEEGELNDGQTD